MTKIEYEVPGAGHVTIKIVDIIGTQVRVLKNQHDKAGKYSADLIHESLAPGKYYYNIHLNSRDLDESAKTDDDLITSGYFKVGA